MCEGEGVFVHPNGEPVKYWPKDISNSSIMWQRSMDIPLDTLPVVRKYDQNTVAPDGKKKTCWPST